jgi:rhamnosyltransferase
MPSRRPGIALANDMNPVGVAEYRPDPDHVGAVFVTHHPKGDFADRVRALRIQVSQALIIDNGSTAEEMAMIRGLAETGVAQTLFNNTNLGVAEALNQGLAWGEEARIPWIATFDQDTDAGPSLVATAGRVFDGHRGKPIAVIGAGWRGAAERCDDVTGIEVPAVITSGSLHSVAGWRALGGFRSEFFIDLVDTEYCLRARANGYAVVRSCVPTMSHQVGSPSRRRLLFRSVTPTNHSRTRRYYMARNRIDIWRRYFGREPRFVIGDMTEASKEFIKLVLFEEDKGPKVRAMLRGTVDGIRGNFGRLALPGSESPAPRD